MSRKQRERIIVAGFAHLVVSGFLALCLEMQGFSGGLEQRLQAEAWDEAMTKLFLILQPQFAILHSELRRGIDVACPEWLPLVLTPVVSAAFGMIFVSAIDWLRNRYPVFKKDLFEA
ncbi:MAG TPA: hypothetical protein VI454_13535 [Verrucomicrobiae bacterium]|jgi:hypothetical protein